VQPLYLRPVFRSKLKEHMKNLLVILLFAAGGLVQAQESQTRSVSSFTGVKAAEGVDVYLSKGEKESVRVEVTGTNLENIITEVSGSYLKVHMRDGNYKGRVDAKVYVTYVKIDKLSASSAGSIFSEGTIEASNLDISSSSAANIEVTVNAGSVNVNSSSAGEIELKGKARTLSAEAASAGEIDAYDLESRKVEAEASSAGSIKVNATEELDAHAGSGGSIRYRGNPDKSVTNSSSGGSVKKSN
jgi:Putative auto-transporter adhesin, head GIN domain